MGKKSLVSQWDLEQRAPMEGSDIIEVGERVTLTQNEVATGSPTTEVEFLAVLRSFVLTIRLASAIQR